MKNANTKKTWMNRLQKVIGATLIASALCACGTGAELASQNQYSDQVERAEQDEVQMAMPEMESLADDRTQAQWDAGDQEAQTQMASQDQNRVFYFGDIQVSSAAELKEYHRYTHVVGNIEITTDEDAFMAWPNLRAVAGDLVVSENENMTRVEFVNLDRVYGALLLNANPKLEEFSMPDLSRVTDRIYVTKNFSLSDCYVQKLEEDLAKAGQEVTVVNFHNQEGEDCADMLD